MRSFGSFWTLAYKNEYKGQEKRPNKVAEGGVAGALPNWAKYLPFKGALEDSSKFIYGQFFSSIEEDRRQVSRLTRECLGPLQAKRALQCGPVHAADQVHHGLGMATSRILVGFFLGPQRTNIKFQL